MPFESYTIFVVMIAAIIKYYQSGRIVQIARYLFGFIFISFLYYHLFIQHDISLMTEETFKASDQSSLLLLFSVLLLMPLNWLLESLKWHQLVNRFQSFNLKESIYSVLSGASLAIMTPARFGEYGGRLLGIYKENRIHAIGANAYASLAQNLVNIGIGLMGTMLYLNWYTSFNGWVLIALSIFSLCIIVLLSLLYHIPNIIQPIQKILPYSWRKIWIKSTSFMEKCSTIRHEVLLLTIVRYFVYVSQYVLLVLFFGLTEDVFIAYTGVITIFFFQSNLPLPPILNLFARGEIAILLWSTFTVNTLGILAATFTLWCINLIIPATFGSLIIMTHKNNHSPT